MKKVIFVFLLCLFGCTTSDEEAKVKEAQDVVGNEGAFGIPLVSVKIEAGEIIEVSIDEIVGETTKREMAEEYQLSDTAIAPWSDQVDALETYIEQNGLDAIELVDGKVVNADLVSSVTIQVDEYLKTIEKAITLAE